MSCKWTYEADQSPCEGIDESNLWFVRDENGRLVAEVEVEADAASIVRDHNARDALVDALNKSLDHNGYGGTSSECNNGSPRDCRCWVCDARTALKGGGA